MRDPDNGLLILNEAYAIGARAALGFEHDIRAYADCYARNDRTRHAILTQYQMGRRHEHERGEPLPDDADSA